MKQWFRLGVLCMALGISAHKADAGAFAHEDLAASAAGVANAVVAGADDIAAAIYNPSGLAWQEGVQGMIGSQSRYRTLSVNLNGTTYGGDAYITDLTSFAFSWLEEGKDWGVATAMVTPYGRGTRWSAPFSGLLRESNIAMKRYSADGFWRVRNTLALSLGVDIYDVKLFLQRSNASFSGSSWSDIGMHAGLRWEFAPFWTLGVLARQGAGMTITDSALSRLPLTLPDELTVALAHDLSNDALRFELDVKHSRWSSLTDMVIANAGVSQQMMALNLDDTTDISLGMTWFWRDNTQLRFGYAYEPAANTPAAFQAGVADQLGHRLSAGFGGAMYGMHLDVAYTAVLYADTTASGAYAGTYSDRRQTLMFSLSKLF